MDCTDINVLLSGLIDDEVDANTRHAAERHFVECKTCRDLLNEAESLNTLIALDAGSQVDPSGLPADFANVVLSRTVYTDPPATVAGWTNWLGWLAAAAALALAVSIWIMDQNPSSPPVASSLTEEATDFVPPVRSSGGYLASYVYDEDDASDDATSGNPVDAGPIRFSAKDMYTLDSASWLLDMLLVNDESGYADVEQIRSIANYEGLMSNLTAVRNRIDLADRPAVYSAETILQEVIDGSVQVDALERMRGDVRQLDLSARLADIASRWQPASGI